MDLKRIRYAVALAEELNFARTSEKLHLSQPALSRAIQTLEEELGLLLFDRDNRNVQLTTAGAVFIEQARRLLFQMRNLEHDMGLLREARHGHIAFGAGPLPTAAIVPPLVRHLRQQRPNLRLSVSSNNWVYLLQHLRAEEIEFFVADTRDIAKAPDLEITPLCRQYGPLICRAGHPLAQKADRKFKDILAYGFAALRLPHNVKAGLAQALGIPPGEALPIVFECDNLSVLIEMTCNDDVILLATEASVVREIAAGTLAVVEVPDMPNIFAETGIVQLAGRTLSPAALLVLDSMRAITATLPSCQVWRQGAYH
jgi:DNA-binding transcriptional LysR family regulator